MISQENQVEAFYETLRENLDNPFDIFPVKDLTFPPHFHYSFEVVIVRAGEVVLRIDNRTHVVNAGQIAVIPPGAIHGYELSTGCLATLILFMEHEFPDIGAIFAANALATNVIDFPDHGVERLVDTYDRRDRSPSSILAFKGYVNTLFAGILRRVPLIKKPVDTRDRLLRRVLVYVRQEYVNGINLEETARVLGVSTAHLSRTFARTVGCSFNEYLSQIRVARAKRLLRDASTPVIDIAAECGFANQRTFDRTFKRYTSTTPSDYRRHHAV